MSEKSSVAIAVAQGIMLGKIPKNKIYLEQPTTKSFRTIASSNPWLSGNHTHLMICGYSNTKRQFVQNSEEIMKIREMAHFGATILG